MAKEKEKGACGIKRLIDNYRQVFRIRENQEHYAPDDFRRAEALFIKHCLKNGYAGSVHDSPASVASAFAGVHPETG